MKWTENMNFATLFIVTWNIVHESLTVWEEKKLEVMVDLESESKYCDCEEDILEVMVDMKRGWLGEELWDW